jgi:hypothetical protein
MTKQYKVLTVDSSIKDGDFTYNVMSNGKVHVNNHKTNKNSMMGDSPKLASLLVVAYLRGDKEHRRNTMKSITLTGEQIRRMASFVGFSVAEDQELDETSYVLETDVEVEGVKEDLFLYTEDYPEEGGAALGTQLGRGRGDLL